MAGGKLTECGQRARRCARSDWLDHSEWTARGGKVVSGHMHTSWFQRVVLAPSDGSFKSDTVEATVRVPN